MRIEKALLVVQRMQGIPKRVRRRHRARSPAAKAIAASHAGFHVFPFSPTLWVAVGPDFFGYHGHAYFCGNGRTPVEAIELLLGHRDAYRTWRMSFGVLKHPESSDFKMHHRRLEPNPLRTPE
jgi:hypothetical protein